MIKPEDFIKDYNGDETIFPRRRVEQLLKYYAEYILKQAAEQAMVQEEIPFKRI